MSPFKISVILPNYNHGKYLSRCLDSILNQSFLPYEIIVIDDYSIDNSKTIINKYKKDISNLTAIFNSSNHGTIYCQNVGLNHASGDFILFAAADDYLLNDFFLNMYNVFLNDTTLHLITGCSRIKDLVTNKDLGIRPTVLPLYKDGYVSKETYLNLLHKSDYFILTGSCLIRHSTIMNFEGLNNILDSFSDGYLVRLIALNNGFYFLNQTVSVWSISNDSFSKKNQININRSLKLIKIIKDNMSDCFIFPSWYIKKFQTRWLFYTIFKNKSLNLLIRQFILSENLISNSFLNFTLKSNLNNYLFLILLKYFLLLIFFPHSIKLILITKLSRLYKKL